MNIYGAVISNQREYACVPFTKCILSENLIDLIEKKIWDWFSKGIKSYLPRYLTRCGCIALVSLSSQIRQLFYVES